MDEAEKYQQRLSAIAEKRRLQEEQERAKRQLEDEKLRLQQLKRKSLRDQWLMEGPPLSPNNAGPQSPLWGPKAQLLEQQIHTLLNKTQEKTDEHMDDVTLAESQSQTHHHGNSKSVGAVTPPPSEEEELQSSTSLTNSTTGQQKVHHAPLQTATDTGIRAETLIFLGYTEAESGQGLCEDDKDSEVIRAERVIITDDGEEVRTKIEQEVQEEEKKRSVEEVKVKDEERGEEEEIQDEKERSEGVQEEQVRGEEEVQDEGESGEEKEVQDEERDDEEEEVQDEEEMGEQKEVQDEEERDDEKEVQDEEERGEEKEVQDEEEEVHDEKERGEDEEVKDEEERGEAEEIQDEEKEIENVRKKEGGENQEETHVEHSERDLDTKAGENSKKVSDSTANRTVMGNRDAAETKLTADEDLTDSLEDRRVIDELLETIAVQQSHMEAPDGAVLTSHTPCTINSTSSDPNPNGTQKPHDPLSSGNAQFKEIPLDGAAVEEEPLLRTKAEPLVDAASPNPQDSKKARCQCCVLM